jgi:hypothetical protein
VQVIGKGNRERLAPRPKVLGQVFGRRNKGNDDLVFATEPGATARGPHAWGPAGLSGRAQTRSPADRIRSMSASPRNSRHRDAIVCGRREGLIERL